MCEAFSNTALLKRSLEILNEVPVVGRTTDIILLRSYITTVHDRLNGALPSPNEHFEKLVNRSEES